MIDLSLRLSECYEHSRRSISLSLDWDWRSASLTRKIKKGAELKKTFGVELKVLI